MNSWIGLRPDQREIKSPPITHQIAVVEEKNNNSPSTLKTNYVRISELEEPDTCPPNPKSDGGPKKSVDILEPELLSSEVSLTPDPKLGRGSDLNPPTRPDIPISCTYDSSLRKQSITFGPDSSLSKTRLKIAATKTRSQYSAIIARTKESSMPSTAIAYYTSLTWQP